MKKTIKNFINKSVNVSLLRMYERGEENWAKPFSKLSKYLCCFFSPTWMIARISNRTLSRVERTQAIIARNYFYLTCSIFLLALVGGILPAGFLGKLEVGDFYVAAITILLWCVPFSRCNEIFYAFISDALDKTSGKPKNSDLTYRKRIELSFLSYLELIINFAILYYLMPLSWFGDDKSAHFSNVIDALYFSGVTITTLGYGDFSPVNAIPQLLVVQQVLVGFTLIVVSFAIYAGKGLSIDNAKSSESET
ncbi:hypothetical protein BTO01_24185 [Vibrio jasicida]|uniref:potassium channel family protein n=1 Tax=Vibrio jasicida TaxID=766224 RepID=UPI000CF4D8C4|nr:potassium channel family protein [Vibrio jasicida]EKO3844571.1 two pore domain potassium channel family protein [Vibrio harveyi]PQJ50468.1 hypothetical protein BTO01_24185 [Vibrio jasicida]